MKILHCSDLHLGKRPSGTKKFSDLRFEDFFKAFERLIDKVSNLEVDIFIISGDFFDKKEIGANILDKTENLLKKLKAYKKDLRIIVIEGNHDVINRNEDSWLEYLKLKNYIEVYSYKKDFETENFFKIKDVNFYPVGYPGFLVDKALENLSEKLNPNEKNIVIVHTAMSGSNSLPGLVSTKTIDLFKDKVIYMAGGHIHSFSIYPKEKPYFFVSGSLEFSNIPNEKSDRKGAVYFDTDRLEYEFIEVEHRKRIKAEIFSYEKDIEEEFREYMRNLNLTGEEIILVPIKQIGNEYINIERLEEIASQNGALKVYFEIKSKVLLKENEFNEEVLSIDDMEKNIIENWNTLENDKILAQKFNTLKELFLNEQTDEFMTIFDKILEEDDK